MNLHVTAVVEEARKHLGYRAGPGRIQPFGPRGLPWNGAFIDFVLGQRGLTTGTVHATAAGAQAYYAGHGKMRQRGKRGDVVFLADGNMGLVTEVGLDGRFRSVEAETASPLPKAEAGAVGVYEHNRFKTDVIGFARPRYRFFRVPSADGVRAEVRLSDFAAGNRLSIGLVQAALRVPLAGSWNSETRSAYKACQRRYGLVPLADGVPDFETLTRLGRETGLFTVRI